MTCSQINYDIFFLLTNSLKRTNNNSCHSRALFVSIVRTLNTCEENAFLFLFLSNINGFIIRFGSFLLWEILDGTWCAQESGTNFIVRKGFLSFLAGNHQLERFPCRNFSHDSSPDLSQCPGAFWPQELSFWTLLDSFRTWSPPVKNIPSKETQPAGNPTSRNPIKISHFTPVHRETIIT